ncbi:MAG TPA: serine hydrolase domain-containing protein [Bradyrhizobium sp.]|nr:serine hydrolase domain-containing protein [Bradyrhizobium sp.]
MSESSLAAFDERMIDAVFAEVDQSRLPGAVVGIAVDGKPVYRKGFGLASMELPVVLSPAARMPIGSATKHFTCLAYMLQCEEGRANVDDPIGKYLPELNPVIKSVTMRQLMGHLGGLRDIFDICTTFSGTAREVRAADAIALYRDMNDMNAAPGVTWSYNNGGYMLLSAAIERITDQPFEEVLRTRIFEPVGMFDTLLRHFDTNVLHGAATLHKTSEKGGFEKGHRYIEGGGQGGIVSTVNDMLRWMAHMDAPVVGRRETWKLMRTPQTVANGFSTGYGLGLMTGSYRGADTLFHTGSVVGCNSQMLKVPCAGLDIVVMVNRDDILAPVLVNKVLDICLTDLEPVEDETERAPATGRFRSPKSGRVIQLVAKGAQQIVSIDGTDLLFAPDAEGVLTFMPVGGPTRMSVTLVGVRERPTGVILSEFGNADEFVPAAPAGNADALSIAGQYCSAGTGSTVTVEADGRVHATGRFGSAEYRVEPLIESVWRMRATAAPPIGGILSFDEHGFRFSNGNTRALAFRRV